MMKKLLSKKSFNLANILKKVNYIVLSPGVSLNKSKNKNKLKKYKKNYNGYRFIVSIQKI